MLIMNFCGIATTFASKANHLDVIFFLINQIIFTSICHQNNRYSIHSVAGLIIAIGGWLIFYSYRLSFISMGLLDFMDNKLYALYHILLVVKK